MTTMTTLNMDLIVRHLREDHGIANAYVEMTGGGVATIFAGPTREEPDYGTRSAAIAGPGTFGNPSLADTVDFYIGADDDGETMPVATADLGPVTESDVARIIAAQANRPDPTTAVDTATAATLVRGDR